MVDWSSAASLQNQSVAHSHLNHIILGIYVWELLCSLDFEWDFITGKKEFRWPMIFYFAGRYSCLFFLIGDTVGLDTTQEINCQLLYTVDSVMAAIVFGCASINLSIRAVAVWGYNKHIVALFACIILGHWAILLRDAFFTLPWETSSHVCMTDFMATIMAASCLYTMAFDFVALALTGFKLFNTRLVGSATRSRIAKLIFTDGLIYFIVTFLSHMPASVFKILGVSPVMGVMFDTLTVVVSTIAASRAVRRLTNFVHPRPTSTTVQGSRMTGRFNGYNDTRISGVTFANPPTLGKRDKGSIGIAHVEIDDEKGDDFSQPGTATVDAAVSMV